MNKIHTATLASITSSGIEKSPTKLGVVIRASISGDMIQNGTTQTDYTFTSLKYLCKKGIYTLGPIVTLTASANSSTPLSIKARAWTPNLMSLAA